tara:strand:+ start:337 stop:1014 length:678 start_codon:yes stop_codon:yes gene_type:complete
MKNFSKRIITSVILLFIISISLFYNKYVWLFFLLLVSLILFIEFENLLKKIWNKEKITNSLNIFSLFFLVLLIYVSYKSYNKPPSSLVFVILICIFSDTGGYVIGNLLGGKKLTKISPNKTISGSIGSFIFSLFPILIFLFLYNFTHYNDYFSMFLTESYYYLIPFCLFLCLICQLGDLFISYFKRKAKVDDTGSILPGHGGLLDRIDGVIFVLPIAYLIDKIFF